MDLRSLAVALSISSAAPALAANAELPPGVDAAGLTAPQREVLARLLADAYCHCGCPHTLAGCLKEHRTCRHAPRMAQLAVKLAATGAAAPDAQRVLTEYYAGFAKKRPAFNVKDFGPPLGKPDAPVTIVEFSDFTCPFCRALRPRLEAWVKSREGRVKLFYKPFPLANHARSMEAAEAAEWAREKGFFWQMHDVLFENPHDLADDDLARYALRLGGSADDLREALSSKRFRPRIFAARAEATAAGLAGTPTLYVNGRKHVLTFGTREDPLANVEWGLDFALADEEEWMKNGGWSKD
jgi:protein-disulfide isomerase